MKLSRARLCLDCDEVFHLRDACPVCGSQAWAWITTFLDHPRERLVMEQTFILRQQQRAALDKRGTT